MMNEEYTCNCLPNMHLRDLWRIDISKGPVKIPDLEPETPETQATYEAVEKSSAALQTHYNDWQNRPKFVDVLKHAGVTPEQYQRAKNEMHARSRDAATRQEQLECETLQKLAIPQILAIHLPDFEGRRSHCIVEWDDGIIDRVIQHMESAGFVVARHSKDRRKKAL
jgi:hypothetical protein